MGYSAMSSGSNSFANGLTSFSYVDSYIFRPQLCWLTTQPVERYTERYIVWTHLCSRSGRSGLSVWSVAISPHIHSNCDLKVANTAIQLLRTTPTWNRPYHILSRFFPNRRSLIGFQIPTSDLNLFILGNTPEFPIGSAWLHGWLNGWWPGPLPGWWPEITFFTD